MEDQGFEMSHAEFLSKLADSLPVGSIEDWQAVSKRFRHIAESIRKYRVCSWRDEVAHMLRHKYGLSTIESLLAADDIREIVNMDK